MSRPDPDRINDLDALTFAELVRLFHRRLEWWRQKSNIGYDRQLHVLAAKVQYRRRKIKERRQGKIA